MPLYPPAPKHLTSSRKTLWQKLVREYDLDLPGLELLRLACEALDRGEEARRVLADEGSFVTDRYGGRRVHPGVGVERDSRLAAARLFRELDLEGDPLPAPRHRRR